MDAAGARGPAPLPRLLQLAAWSALLAGVGELVLRVVARTFLPDPVFIHPAGFWLGPLAALLLFAPVIAIGWSVGRLRSQATAWLIAVGLSAALAIFDVLLLVPRVHVGALAILAIGLATQVAWVAHRWPTTFRRWVLGSSGILVLLALVAGPLATRRVVAARSEGGPPSGAPSVLLLVLDTVRALELSAYGYFRPTSPAVAALGAEGVKFERAVATAPWTLPTHASIFTGRYQRDLSVGWLTPLDAGPPTIAEHLAALGYATGGFVANHRYTTREYGLDRGFQAYGDYAVVGNLAIGSTMLGRLAITAFNALTGRDVIPGRKDAARIIDEFLAWQRQVGGRPYFAFLNFFDAHDPYAPESPYDLMFAGVEPPARRIETGRPHSAEEIQGLQDAYDGAITYLDVQLGRLFDSLRVAGTLDETLIIVTADHGEEFAEHGHLGHGSGLHFPALHVPLIVRWPGGGVPGGVEVDDPVSLVDLPATIIDLVGSGDSAAFPGTSLAPLWRGGPNRGTSPVLSELYWVANQPESYPVAGGDMRSLVRGRYHLIAGPGAREELYDIQADPFERQDLAGQPELADTLRSLRADLARFPMRDRGGR